MSAITNLILGQIIRQKMDEQKQQKSMDGLGRQLGVLQNVAGEVESGEGLMSKPMGAFQKVKQFMGINPELDQYEGIRTTLASQISRKIAGETAALSQGDIDRVMKGIPDTWDSTEARQRKFSALQQLIQAVSQNPQGGGGMDLMNLMGE